MTTPNDEPVEHALRRARPTTAPAPTWAQIERRAESHTRHSSLRAQVVLVGVVGLLVPAAIIVTRDDGQAVTETAALAPERSSAADLAGIEEPITQPSERDNQKFLEAEEAMATFPELNLLVRREPETYVGWHVNEVGVPILTLEPGRSETAARTTIEELFDGPFELKSCEFSSKQLLETLSDLRHELDLRELSTRAHADMDVRSCRVRLIGSYPDPDLEAAARAVNTSVIQLVDAGVG